MFVEKKSKAFEYIYLTISSFVNASLTKLLNSSVVFDSFIAFRQHSIACNDDLDYDSPVGTYLYSHDCSRWYLALPCVQKALTEMLKQTT